MSVDDVRALIKSSIKTAGTAAAWAKTINLSPQYVGDVLHGRRDPGDTILTALGLQRSVTYIRSPRAALSTRRTKKG